MEIEIKPEKNLFTAYYMNQIKLIDGDNKEINSNDRTFNIYKTKI